MAFRYGADPTTSSESVRPLEALRSRRASRRARGWRGGSGNRSARRAASGRRSVSNGGVAGVAAGAAMAIAPTAAAEIQGQRDQQAAEPPRFAVHDTSPRVTNLSARLGSDPKRRQITFGENSVKSKPGFADMPAQKTRASESKRAIERITAEIRFRMLRACRPSGSRLPDMSLSLPTPGLEPFGGRVFLWAFERIGTWMAKHLPFQRLIAEAARDVL